MKKVILNQLRKDAEKLNAEYDTNLLLRIIRRYRKITINDDIENRMYFEAHQEMLEELECGSSTIQSYYDDIELIFKEYEEFLKDYNRNDLLEVTKSLIRVNLTLPFDLLLLIFVVNHPEYVKGMDLFDFEEHLTPVVEALKGVE